MRGTSRRDTWLAFGLIGLIVGLLGAYFGLVVWPAGLSLIAIAALIRPRLAALSGASGGLALGMFIMLWVGSRCPFGAQCEPMFPIGIYVATAILLVVVALACGLAMLRSAER
jgi:hypothetical protein